MCGMYFNLPNSAKAALFDLIFVPLFVSRERKDGVVMKIVMLDRIAPLEGWSYYRPLLSAEVFDPVRWPTRHAFDGQILMQITAQPEVSRSSGLSISVER